MIRVLVVEDEPLTADAHAAYVRRVEGFEVAAITLSGAEAIHALRADPTIALILLDMNLPDMCGLDLCRSVRAAELCVDIIAVTAVRDAAVVRASVSAGIVQYLIKPFVFSGFAAKLASYRAFRERMHGTDVASQHEVDGAFAALRTSNAPGLARGLSTETVEAVTALLRPVGLSSGELASHLDISRVTARRYLEHLADAGVAERALRKGVPGRPELEYRRR
ncbi:response regulator [Rathayibacter toxicus]|uniref:Transcriptional regulatory protein n=1 Tax=Rathayibacter toxicus TaxID=145458 RepID=A0A2S5Y8C2_9MICO|nr:response regulator [Rathayibacter toxicus]PPH24745.1 HTH domain-containing protein [Rathayibacter toxicus]PPH58673.1 HTH domain-containing protein [Rathayibacter toxicus]PPH60665.1 HTH domain-containing protein [Rathayibacter toxicus]PPH88485.1 HTH domain-containing protein [Rathayibacter toxicus]PPI16178.1 HTH domain-containing protein [Rathayibacter toxicus]